MKEFLLFLALLCSHFGLGQAKIPILAFHMQEQQCHVMGATIFDYTIELFSDSSICIARYRKSTADYFQSVEKTTYLGKYLQTADTLIVKYSSAKIEMKQKLSWVQKKDSIYKNLKPVYPDSVFLLRKNSMTTATNGFAILNAVPIPTVQALEATFANWEIIDSKRGLVEGVKNSLSQNR